jgi:hypothetical protein
MGPPQQALVRITSDYNKCETAVTNDPKLQQGNQLLLLNATERCIQEEVWRLIEQ